MVDTKISELTNGGSILSTDQVPVARGEDNYRVQVGTVASHAFSEFALAAQGALADTSLQEGEDIDLGLYTLEAANIGILFEESSDDTITGVVNGSNTDFTLTHAPIAYSLILCLNGLKQTLDSDYTLDGVTVTFVLAPSGEDKINANYQY